MFRSLLNNAFVHANHCNERGVPYKCPSCNARVHLRRGAERAAHFAHAAESECPYSKPELRESEDHFEATKLISESLRALGYEVKLNRTFEGRRIAMLASRPDPESPGMMEHYAIEVQKDDMTNPQRKAKSDWFHMKGIHPLWIRVTSQEYTFNKEHFEPLFEYEPSLLYHTGRLFHFDPNANPNWIHVIEKGYPDAKQMMDPRKPFHVIREPMALELFDPAKVLDLPLPMRGTNLLRPYEDMMPAEFRRTMGAQAKTKQPACPSNTGSPIPNERSRDSVATPTNGGLQEKKSLKFRKPVKTGQSAPLVPAKTQSVVEIVDLDAQEWIDDETDCRPARYHCACLRCGDVSAKDAQSLCDACDVFWEIVRT